jgi:uncharacterized protein (TIGR02246 family)
MVAMKLDEQAIREVISTWLRATSAGDLARVLELMDDDVVFLGAGRPPMRGKDAFAAATKAAEGQNRIEGSADVQEVRVFGDWAYCWNQLTVRMYPQAGGAASEMRGPVLSIFRKRPDGAWVIVRDANMLTPAR